MIKGKNAGKVKIKKIVGKPASGQKTMKPLTPLRRTKT